MIPVGQPYRPEGSVHPRSLLSATILGLVAASLAAGAVWLWEISPIPTLLIVTPVIQGLLVGLILMLLIGRLRLRHPRLMGAIGFACGLASVALVHEAHHLRLVAGIENEYREQVAADADLTPEERRERLAGAGQAGDALLALRTGHGGLLGSMLLRSEIGFHLKRTHVTGWGVWGVWAVEALFVACFAAAMAASRAGEPYCEDCGDWCAKARAPIEVAGESAPALAAAIQDDDLRDAGLVLAAPGDAEALAAHGTRATLHACPGCDQAFADVESYQIVRKGKKTETRTTPHLRRVRVSPEMAALLREPAGAGATAPACPEGDGLDEPREPGAREA